MPSRNPWKRVLLNSTRPGRGEGSGRSATAQLRSFRACNERRAPPPPLPGRRNRRTLQTTGSAGGAAPALRSTRGYTRAPLSGRKASCRERALLTARRFLPVIAGCHKLGLHPLKVLESCGFVKGAENEQPTPGPSAADRPGSPQAEPREGVTATPGPVRLAWMMIHTATLNWTLSKSFIRLDASSISTPTRLPAAS